MEKVAKVLKDIKTNFGAMVKSIRDWWIDLAFKMALKWVEWSTKIKRAGKAAWDGIKNAFKGAVNWFGRAIISPIVNKFKEIKNAFKESIGSGLKAVFNVMTTPINNMITALNKIKNAIPGVKNLPSIPRLPRLAQGGITNGPTLAMVGDNVGGREVISPLDKLQGIVTNSVIQALQAGGGGNRTTGDIILNIDGRSFARIVKPFLDREQSRVGNDVRIKTT